MKKKKKKKNTPFFKKNSLPLMPKGIFISGDVLEQDGQTDCSMKAV